MATTIRDLIKDYTYEIILKTCDNEEKISSDEVEEAIDELMARLQGYFA